MKIVGTVKEVREQVKEWKKQGLSVGFVPTMGYLHEGHKSLMDAARKGNDKVVKYFRKSNAVWTNRGPCNISKRFKP